MGSRLEFATFCKHSVAGRSRCIWGRGGRVDKVGFRLNFRNVFAAMEINENFQLRNIFSFN